MKKKILSTLTNLLFPLTLSATSLIPREDLFRQPSCLGIKVSPDASRLAYIGANREGTMNLFVASELSLDNAKQVTEFSDPQIGAFHWSADSKKILLTKDKDGTRQYQLYSYDLLSSELKHLTAAFQNINSKIFRVSATENKAIIGINHRNPRFHDLYLLDLNSNLLTLIYKNDSYINFLFDNDLQIVLKTQIHQDCSVSFVDKNDKILINASADEAFQTECLRYDETEQALYLIDNRGCNTNQLKKISLNGKTTEIVLGHDLRSDINDVLFENGEVVAYANYFTHKEWHTLNAKVKSDLDFISSKVSTNFEIMNQSQDNQVWIIKSSTPESGIAFWLYQRKQNLLSLLHSFPKINNLSKMYPQIIPSRDGLKLVSYLTLPKAMDRDGKTKKPLPLVVVPHGGPFRIRDSYQFSPIHQWLANRGYAVLSVNFRLSSGFGSNFVNAGNGQWGKKAHEDVLDAVKWCVDNRIADREKIAVLGRSYGGYEALASVTFSPDVFSCAVDICGPSNLKTVLDRVPFYWEFPASPLSDKSVFYTKNAFIKSCGGDPDTESGSAYLHSCSPLNYVDNIKKPLLLVHGANDPIVAGSESDQIFEKMKQKGLPVIYISFPDEGHSVEKFANSMCYLAYSEWLLSQYLGGEFEPLPLEQLQKSSAQIQSSGISHDAVSKKS